MLSIKRPIELDDIYSARILAQGHPVFLLEGFGDDRGNIDCIVIKNESGVAANVQVAAMMMNVVDKNARQIPMTNAEVGVLRQFAGAADLPSTEAFRACMEIMNALGQGGTWLKMEYKNLLNLNSAVNHLNQGDDSDVRIIARSLRKSGGLEKLGEIIAADLFNGSNDRFAYPQQPGVPGNQVIQNKGNIFIDVNKMDRGMPVGLDNFDPFGQQRHVSGLGAQNMDVSIHTWGGHLLLRANSGVRQQFIQCVVQDLEALLGGPRARRNPFGNTNRLGTARKSRINRGMEKGARKLKHAFAQLRRQGARQNRQLAEGINRKLTALGW